MALPSWCIPDWRDDDIFSKNPMELNNIKQRVAVVVGCRYRSHKSVAFGSTVAGITPLDPTDMDKTVKAYLELQNQRPTEGTPAELEAARAAWQGQLAAASSITTVINCCMVDWLNRGLPWNIGYVASFWDKFSNGDRSWDATLERKAGGVVVQDGMDYDNMALRITGASSVMALVGARVGCVMRGAACPQHLKTALCGVLTICSQITGLHRQVSRPVDCEGALDLH